jgi:hypothetical protein
MSAQKLLDIVSRPVDGCASLPSWIKQKRLFDLLETQRSGGDLMLYGSAFDGGSILLYSFLVPCSALKPPNIEDLIHWSGPFDSWGCGLVYGGGRPARVELSEPRYLDDSTLGQGYQLTFSRSFEGRSEDKHYYEIAQLLTHAHGLHWTPERRAWCRLNDEGDVADVIRLDEIKGNEGYGSSTSIVMERAVLEQHMSASASALVQLFDSTCTPEDFSSWKERADELISRPDDRLYYRSVISPGYASNYRGVQIVYPAEAAVEFGERLLAEQSKEKQYVTFITQDWKNKTIIDVSSDPKALASYFEENSPLPFQTSPVFFKAQVLDKYKSDPDKYTLDHRSISCRNAWHLP